MKTKSVLVCFLLNLVIILAIALIFTEIAYAQLWIPLPPYNVLWPLWSPALSPPDPLTGIPSPLVTSLDKNTFLPVEPALVWDPSLPYFYFLYNYIPTYGSPYIKYFDPLEGITSPYTSFKTWPPTYLQTAVVDPLTGQTVVIPSPLTLPIGYESLLKFDPAFWLNFWIPLVNPLWQQYYGINPNLLTASQLLNPALTFSATYL